MPEHECARARCAVKRGESLCAGRESLYYGEPTGARVLHRVAGAPQRTIGDPKWCARRVRVPLPLLKTTTLE